MFHNFGYEGSIILKNAEKIRCDCKHPYVGTEHLLISILKEENDVTDILKEYQITWVEVQDTLLKMVGSASKKQELNLYTPMLKRVIELASYNAEENNKSIVLPIHFFMAMLEEKDGIGVSILLNLNLDLDELYEKCRSKFIHKEKKEKQLEIMKIGIPLSESIEKEQKIIGREKEITYMMETLLRKGKNNVLLIGDAGVGKTALVEELERRIKHHEVPENLENMEIIMLEMGSLVAGTKYRGEFEERLHKIIKEVIEERNIILFIDEIHSMVNAGGAEGAIAASDILKPYLARGQLKIIGATTTKEYHKYLEKDKALDRRFEKIMIEEPNKEQMRDILKSIVPSYEKYFHIKINEERIEDILSFSEEYLFSKKNPDKTIDLLDSICARMKVKNKVPPYLKELEKIQKRKEKYILEANYKDAMEEAKKEQEFKLKAKTKSDTIMTKKDILEMIELKTQMPLQTSKQKQMKELEMKLNSNILGQSKALKEIIDVINNEKTKCISMLLVGSSGVGKTETVKVVSDTLKTNLIRIDMSEYESVESINKLIGTPSGYVGYQDSYVFESLKEHPYSTILFDEIEKSHPKVLNLLLQILDESFITDRNGEKIRFDHTLIFLTSNVIGKNTIGFENNTKASYEEVLSKELLGRIDAIIKYDKITKEVAKTYIEKHLHNKKIDIEHLLEESDISSFGLRNLRNLITKYNQKIVTE